MNRVLVLAYYFPPLGLSGVQRITKFVKYLPESGWLPTVVTARPHSYFAFDHSLLDDIPEEVEVVRTRSLDPTRWRRKAGTVGMPASRKQTIWRRMSNRLFVPDNKILWVPFARRAAENVLDSQSIDLIFATAPPFSSLPLAVRLGKRHGLPVVVDFRDNWVGNPRRVFASERQKGKHQKLETATLQAVSRAITINQYIADDMVSRTGVHERKLTVIEQGYDPQDFELRSSVRKTDKQVTFLYSGIFYDAQKPDTFLQALAQARNSDPIAKKRIRALFTGLVPEYFSDMVRKLNLEGVVEYLGYLDHGDAVDRLRQADVAWLTVGNQPDGQQISTGKLAEYIGSRKPILGLVPEGAARDMLERYGAGYVVDPDDVEGACRGIIELCSRIVAGERVPYDESVVNSLDRRLLASRLAAILDEVVASQ